MIYWTTTPKGCKIEHEPGLAIEMLVLTMVVNQGLSTYVSIMSV